MKKSISFYKVVALSHQDCLAAARPKSRYGRSASVPARHACDSSDSEGDSSSDEDEVLYVVDTPPAGTPDDQHKRHLK